jgi:hypothetical protein
MGRADPGADPPLPLFPADYINFMKQVTPETTQEYMTQLKRFNMGAPGESDCPVFDGMYEYFAVSLPTRSSIQACMCAQDPATAPAVACMWPPLNIPQHMEHDVQLL